MRISGTHLNRLTHCILPYTSPLFAVAIYSLNVKGISTITVVSLVVWLFDTIIWRMKGMSSMDVIDGRLMIHQEEISIDDVTTVTPFVDKRIHWSFPYLEIALNQDVEPIVRRIMIKPVHIFKDIEQSETITRLKSDFPELEKKFKTLQNI